MYDIPATNFNGSMRLSYRDWPSIQTEFAEKTSEIQAVSRATFRSEIVIEQPSKALHIDAPASRQDHTKLQLLRPHIDRKLYHRENLHRSGSGKLLLKVYHTRPVESSHWRRGPTHGVSRLAALDMSRNNFDSRNGTNYGFFRE